MWKQEQELIELSQLSSVVGCSSPLVREPIPAEQAIELSRALEALGDPVRLRLASLIASHDGGEACVCDLTGGLRPVRSDDLPPPEGAARGGADLR